MKNKMQTENNGEDNMEPKITKNLNKWDTSQPENNGGGEWEHERHSLSLRVEA